MRVFSTGTCESPFLAHASSESGLLQPCGLEQTSLEQVLAILDRQTTGPSLRDKLLAPAGENATPFRRPSVLLPPILRPSKIFCVGRNYAEHANETGADLPPEPLIFSKMPSTLVGHGAKIRLPSESQKVDFEAELVVVIGKTGRRIPRSEALQYVAGYTCGNDVTARDWQKGKPGQQWLLGKSFDTFAPLGPCFVTADEIPDPQALDISLRLNGQVMQQANTCEMIFPVEELISYISQICTLLPGDLLFTGTPSGVGVARNPPAFLQPGDQVEVEIERIGCLSNECEAG